MGRVVGLVRASHPEPSVVVCVVVAGLGVAAGLALPRILLLAVAVLVGQLSIGWSNDWLDAVRGHDADRSDKPVGGGALDGRTVRTAALVGLAGTTVLSLAMGVVPGTLHLLGVAMGWLYNASLKLTAASVLPYLVAFGLLPSIATTTAGDGTSTWWATVTAATFGAGVHFANVLPDLVTDARVGVRGLPQRLGSTGSVVATVTLLGVGTLTVLLGPPGGPGGVAVAVASVALALLLATAAAGLTGRAVLAYRTAMVVGLVVVGLLVATGSAIA